MITLERDCLTFSFPEVTGQIRALVEAHVQATLRKIRLPANPVMLVVALCKQIERRHSRIALRANTAAELDSCITTAEALTQGDVESALREELRKNSNGTDITADLTIRFQRTLRIPDDGRTYPLPAGLGSFPLRSVDDYLDTGPDEWRKRGGLAMPMYQSEALWIAFESRFPFAVKIAAGKINAISGGAWAGKLQRKPQNYIVVPDQPWLDGFSVGKGLIRQFVAMPLGAGYTVEEQLTGKGDTGGMQIQVYPMRSDRYLKERIVSSLPSTLKELLPRLFAKHLSPRYQALHARVRSGDMGLAQGGLMRQEIYEDPYKFGVWDRSQTKRCFVHLCNSMVWRQITGTNPPYPPLTSEEYKSAGIPWFDYYRDDQKPLKGSKRLAGVKSVAQLGKKKKCQPFPNDTPATPELIIQYGNTRRPEEIREFLDTP
jgi:hypothetical protein